MSSQTPRQSADKNRKRMHHAVLAAIITVVGGVLVAIIGLYNSPVKNVGSGNTTSNSKTTTIGSNNSGPTTIGSNNSGPTTIGSNNSGPTIIDSKNVSIGRQESTFDASNGLLISNVDGDYTIGSAPPTWDRSVKPSGQIRAVISNISNRRINLLRLVIFREGTAMTGIPMLEVDADKLFPRQVASNMARSTGSTPPQRIRVCLTWESETPGQFITLLVSGERGAEPPTPVDPTYTLTPFMYQLDPPDVIFRSNLNDNCSKQGATEKVDIGDSHVYR